MICPKFSHQIIFLSLGFIHYFLHICNLSTEFKITWKQELLWLSIHSVVHKKGTVHTCGINTCISFYISLPTPHFSPLTDETKITNPAINDKTKTQIAFVTCSKLQIAQRGSQHNVMVKTVTLEPEDL